MGSELTDFSASRVTLAGKCGQAFDYQYIKKIPAPMEGARATLGTAVHRAVDAWYTKHDYQQTELADLVDEQWEALLPPAVWNAVKVLLARQSDCTAIAQAILLKRPTLKAPETTKEYLSAGPVVEFSDLQNELFELTERCTTMKWPAAEGPFKAAVRAREMAERMQARWRPLPVPLAVEHPFILEFDGFRVRGAIDQVRLDPSRQGEPIPRMVDIKTGMQPLTQMEAFLQSFLYAEAIRQAEDLPTTDQVAFYLARPDKYQQGWIDYDRHRALASRILNGRARQITMAQFEPSYGHWCKMCDFNSLCSSEINIWKGDGLTAELMDDRPGL